ncbi:MAG: TonB-dependent receptor [Saprospiraceae bacterium]|nr:TonB-dependent receptor [Saprospiraceae bacterium]
MKLLTQLLLTVFLGMAVSTLFGQGVTTASMLGKITDQAGEELIGANIIALHTPSGSAYGNATDASGYFRMTNMRIGGPYTITISYTGYQDFVQEGVYLTLGQTFKLDAKLSETATELAGVEVVAAASTIFDGNRTGQETVVDEELINNLPTISRSLADFARLNPLVSIDEGTDGFSFNIAGQNNRYNAIYIDGAVNNDVFGLSGSGTDGGQTGAGPISIDAIEQIQVSVAPFDVRLSGFAGGAVNAVTRSGTNEIEGSAYYFLRNQDFAGKTPINDLEDDERTKLNDFTAQTSGFRIGGPIIKNKLFFFANAEFQRDEIPEPFEFANYIGNATAADLEALRSKLKDFGYDPGTFTDNTTTLDKNFFLLKLDWNINANNKLSIRHSLNDVDNLEARNSTPTGIRFENGSEFFPSVTNNTTLELNSVFGSKFSNSLKVGFKRVTDDRDVQGQDFPFVTIRDGSGQIQFGGEEFSTANRLDQDVITLTNDFQIFSGRHQVTIGTQSEYFDVGNLFIRQNFGSYQYNTLAQFLNDEPATVYDRSFSQVDNVTGDESKAIAAFTGLQLGFYVQDEFQATDNLKLTAGVRVDVPIFFDDVPENAAFNSTTIPLLESFGYDLQGAKTGSFVKPQLLWSPRLGFNWDVTGDRSTQVRGGIGIFTSRQPLVWFGGAYNNFGFNVGGTRINGRVVFNPDVNQQPVGVDAENNLITQVDLQNPRPSGQIDLFAEDFKLPQILRSNLAVDQKLPWGLVGTLEGLFTKNINNIFYQALNLKPSTETLTGTGDDRPIFNSSASAQIDPTYTGIFLGSNTSEGYSYNIAATLAKNFDKGFSGSVSYSYGDAFSVLDATSSQNNSQWRGYKNVAGRNEIRDAERSVFSAGHRVFTNLTYRIEYAKFGATSITVAYNGQSGRPFTHVITENGFGGMVNDGAFNNANQIYVPTGRNDIILRDVTVAGTTYTPDQQWTILNQYIEDNDDLSENRGGYAEIMGSRVPFSNIIDLKFAQDFFIEGAKGKRNTLQLTLDIFNFSNLLGNLFGENEWGVLYGNSFGDYEVVRFAGYETGTRNPTFTVDPRILQGQDLWQNDRIDTGRLRSSRWQMQVGVRYLFK